MVILSFDFRLAFFLMSAFSGSKYVASFLSNQMEVSHSMLFRLATTFIRPQPSSCHCRFSLISFDISFGKETKNHPPSKLSLQICPENSYLILACKFLSILIQSLVCSNCPQRWNIAYIIYKSFMYSFVLSLIPLLLTHRVTC